jgi:prevent-host-death family protein
VAKRISTLHVRQHIGELLDRVALGRVEFVIERKGKPIAALVSVERLWQMRRFARRRALEVFERRDRIPISEKQALELAFEAQRSARRRPRKPRRTKAVEGASDE